MNAPRTATAHPEIVLGTGRLDDVTREIREAMYALNRAKSKLERLLPVYPDDNPNKIQNFDDACLFVNLVKCRDILADSIGLR